ncbi:MAG: 4-(cytidine 5'-diphospho)-2-C-methyl-D-erythritol kinase [Bacillota bacterium]|nr:4-(cytidine 5'-diphospho)-2-C-methyl-D-erythritol kinase [Bacillota bacterium]
MEIKAPAKINLSLDVLRKRPDGYHDIRMLMQTVELHDNVRIEPCGNGVEVICSNPDVPSGTRNIAYKAAYLLKEFYSINSGVLIKIDKRIPVAAGLAGGSTDAAAVLKGMNILFSIGLKDDELASIGKSVGADVPYCLRGGTMLAEGIGEILTPVSSLPRIELVLVKPRLSVSTQWVYSSLNLEKIRLRPETDKLIKAFEDNNLEYIAENMVNVLETVTAQKYEVIIEIRKRLMEEGALGSMMSGSGPTVFGIFRDRQSSEKACKSILDERWDTYQTYTVTNLL